jgi:N-methylhydantoinase A/oxoprolinase/acetone carboxylase beta subunit
VERHLRFEVSERMAADGTVLRPLREEELWKIKEQLVKAEVEAVAVCLIHAYAYPAHEQQIGTFLRQHLPQLPVSLSSDVLRERREYERTATTVVNAYVQPIMQRYLQDLLQAAEGIHQIANARMMRALRSVSTERGRDPRDFAFIAFSGSGPVHAAGLARELTIGQVIIPPLPGLFSALGLLFSGIEHHDVRSCLLSGPTLTTQALEALLTEMRVTMLAQFASEGFAEDEVSFSCAVDMRFRGQASEIRIAYPAATATTISALIATFEAEHEQLYGHRSDPDNPVEVVAVRVVGRTVAQEIQRLGEAAPLKPAIVQTGQQPTRAWPILAQRVGLFIPQSSPGAIWRKPSWVPC